MSHLPNVSNLRTDSKPCRVRQSPLPDFACAKYFFAALALNHFRCGKWAMLYLLDRSRRPRLLRPARFWKRGGRANRRRCARWRRFPSDCRVQPHSDMGNVVLCRNFSGEAFVSRWLPTREIRRPSDSSTGSEAPGRVTSRPNEAALRLNDFDVRALPAEFETDLG